MPNFGPRPFDERQFSSASGVGLGGGFNVLSAASPLPLFSAPSLKSGGPFVTKSTLDFQLVGSDAASGQNWASRQGGFTAVVHGTPTVNLETPFYPNALYAGSGYAAALGGFSAANYYQVAFNAAHELNASNGRTYFFALQAGDLSATEVFFSRYISGSTDYNFRVWTDTANLRVKVGRGTTAATSTMPISKYALLIFAVRFNNATGRTEILWVDQDFGTTITGSGTFIDSGSSGDIYIGKDESSGNPVVTGKIIEIARYTEVMTDQDIVDTHHKWFSIADAYNRKYTAGKGFTRVSCDATMVVNNKLWVYGWSVPRMTNHGLFFENTSGGVGRQNRMKNSAFRLSALTNWTVNVAGTSTAAQDTTDADRFTTAGGNACKIVTDSLASVGEISQVASLAFGTPETVTICADWKTSVAAGMLYVLIQNDVTLKYWTGSTWSLVPTYVPIASTSTLTRRRDYISFTTENSGANLTITFSNGANAVNASSNLFIFEADAYLEVSYIPLQRIVTEGAVLGAALDKLRVDNSFALDSKGTFTCIYTPNTPPTIPSVDYNHNIISNQTSALPLVKHRNQSNSETINDGTTSNSITMALTAETEYPITAKWNAAANTKSLKVASSTISGTYDGAWLSGADIAIGQRNDGNDELNGWIKNILITKF